MQNEFEPVAIRNGAGFVQYVCQACGGYQTLIGASDKFLPFIDHLICDLALLEHPKLPESASCRGSDLVSTSGHARNDLWPTVLQPRFGRMEETLG